VGDWVAVEQRPAEPLWHLHAVLDRRTRLVRKMKGSATTPQLIAANLTTIVIVMGLTEDYSPRRMERYLTVVHDSGARPVVVLNKADLLDNALRAQSLAEIRRRAPGCAVHLVSALEGEGLAPLAGLLRPGETTLLTGSSGAGKSTLINALLGEERQAVGDVRRGDGKGRHTTTTRELFVIPGRGTIIDSPGIRELQLWSVQAEALRRTFCDIEDLVNSCRYSDCSHQSEPGCAVRPALEEGKLDWDRLEHWQQLKRELDVLRLREGERGDVTRRAFKAWRTRSRR
jgi:ribosome biogenesis GTPase